MMHNEDLSRYDIGQKVWFIDGWPEPEVKSAEVVEKYTCQTRKGTDVSLLVRDQQGVHKSAGHCFGFALYSTKAAANKQLNTAREKAYLQAIANCELEIGRLKMEIKKSQDELETVEKEKKQYSEKLNEVRE